MTRLKVIIALTLVIAIAVAVLIYALPWATTGHPAVEQVNKQYKDYCVAEYNDAVQEHVNLYIYNNQVDSEKICHIHQLLYQWKQLHVYYGNNTDSFAVAHINYGADCNGHPPCSAYRSAPLFW